MDESILLFGFGLGTLYLLAQLLYFGWHVAILVLLYKIWQKLKTIQP